MLLDTLTLSLPWLVYQYIDHSLQFTVYTYMILQVNKICSHPRHLSWGSRVTSLQRRGHITHGRMVYVSMYVCKYVFVCVCVSECVCESVCVRV